MLKLVEAGIGTAATCSVLASKPSRAHAALLEWLPNDEPTSASMSVRAFKDCCPIPSTVTPAVRKRTSIRWLKADRTIRMSLSRSKGVFGGGSPSTASKSSSAWSSAVPFLPVAPAESAALDKGSGAAFAISASFPLFLSASVAARAIGSAGGSPAGGPHGAGGLAPHGSLG